MAVTHTDRVKTCTAEWAIYTRATEGRRPFFLISRNFGLTIGPPRGMLEV